eukprot:3042964-Prymnesium_polylepis.1
MPAALMRRGSSTPRITGAGCVILSARGLRVAWHPLTASCLRGCGTLLRIGRERAKLAANRAAARRTDGWRCANDL